MQAVRIRYVMFSLTVCASICQLQGSGAVQDNLPYCQPMNGIPVPQIYKFNVKSETEQTGGSCIMAHLAAYFRIGRERYLELKDGKVGGSCYTGNGTESHLKIEFECGYIDLRIVRKEKNKPIKIADMTGRIAIPDEYVFKNSPVKVGVKAKSAGHAYRCNSEQIISLRKATRGGVESVSLVMSDLLIEAFRDESMPGLYQPQDVCALDHRAASYFVIAIGLMILAAIGTGIAYWVVSRRH